MSWLSDLLTGGSARTAANRAKQVQEEQKANLLRVTQQAARTGTPQQQQKAQRILTNKSWAVDNSYQPAYNNDPLKNATGTVGLGLYRSALGTGQGLSGLYDLATPGKGTNRLSKALDVKAKRADEIVAQQNRSGFGYKGAQFLGDALTFTGGAPAIKGATTLVGAGVKAIPQSSKVIVPTTKLVTKVSKPLSAVSKPAAARFNTATTNLAKKGAAGRITSQAVRSGVSTPQLLNTGVDMGLGLGQMASKGYDIGWKDVALQGGISAGFGFGLPATAQAAKEVIKPTTKLVTGAPRAITNTMQKVDDAVLRKVNPVYNQLLDTRQKAQIAYDRATTASEKEAISKYITELNAEIRKSQAGSIGGEPMKMPNDPAKGAPIEKTNRVVPDKQTRTFALLDGDYEGAGYRNHNGIWVDNAIDDTITNKLTPELSEKLKAQGITMIEKTPTETGMQYGTLVVGKNRNGVIRISDEKNFAQTTRLDDGFLHESGHGIWLEKMSQEDKDLFTRLNTEKSHTQAAHAHAGRPQGDEASESFSDYVAYAVDGQNDKIPANVRPIVEKYVTIPTSGAPIEKTPNPNDYKTVDEFIKARQGKVPEFSDSDSKFLKDLHTKYKDTWITTAPDEITPSERRRFDAIKLSHTTDSNDLADIYIKAQSDKILEKINNSNSADEIMGLRKELRKLYDYQAKSGAPIEKTPKPLEPEDIEIRKILQNRPENLRNIEAGKANTLEERLKQTNGDVGQAAGSVDAATRAKLEANMQKIIAKQKAAEQSPIVKALPQPTKRPVAAVSKGSQQPTVAKSSVQETQKTLQTQPNLSQAKSNADGLTNNKMPSQQQKQKISTSSQNSDMSGNTYTSTKQQRGFKSNIAQDAETPLAVYKDIPGYNVKPNSKTIGNAAKRVAKDPEGTYNRLLEKGIQKTEDSADALVLLRKLVENDELDKASKLARATAAAGTDFGQAVQIFSAFRRTTPDGALRDAWNIVNKYNASNPKKAPLRITKEQSKRIVDLANDVQSAEYGSREWAKKAALLEREKGLLTPNSLLAKISVVQTMAQLLNPKTAIRNVIGNGVLDLAEDIARIPATGLDKALKAVGLIDQRNMVVPNMKTNWANKLLGLKQGVEDVNLGIRTTGSAGNYDLTREVFKPGSVGNKLEKLLGYELSSMDKAFFTGRYQSSLDNMMKAQKVKTPTAEMKSTAEAEALYATFQNNSNLAKGLQKTKNTLNLNKEWGLGDFILKYPKTPGNIVNVGLDYSPVGFLKSLKSLHDGIKLKNVQSIRNGELLLGRSLVGTGLIAGGAFLAKQGIITGKQDGDYDKSAADKGLGKGPFTFNITALGRLLRGEDTKTRPGDITANYDWLQPNAIQISMGANMIINDGKVDKQINANLDSLGSGVDTITEQPVFRGIKDFVGNLNTQNGGGVGKAAQGIAVDSLSSFTPSIVNQTGQLFDNTKRSTYDKEPEKEALNKILGRTPVARNNLYPALDTLGNEQKQYDVGGNNPFNVFFNPSFINRVKDSPSLEIADKLNQSTGETSQYPRSLTGNQTIDGQKTKLTAQQLYELKKAVGNTTDQVFKNYIKSPEFNALSDEMKVKILSNALTDINAAGKYQLSAEHNLGQYSPSYTGKAKDPTKLQTQLLMGGANAYTANTKEKVIRSKYSQEVQDFAKLSNAEKNAYFQQDPARAKQLYDLAKQMEAELGIKKTSGKTTNKTTKKKTTTAKTTKRSTRTGSTRSSSTSSIFIPKSAYSMSGIYSQVSGKQKKLRDLLQSARVGK